MYILLGSLLFFLPDYCFYHGISSINSFLVGDTSSFYFSPSARGFESVSRVVFKFEKITKELYLEKLL